MFLRLACLAVVLSGLDLAGCGYHVVGSDPQLPDEIRSIGVGTITNSTAERGLEKDLAFALEREIHVRGHYRMAESPGDADALMTGRIREILRHPVAFDENDQAVQYDLAILVDLALQRRSDGKVLWRARRMRLQDEYASNPGVVITSSAQFQRGTLDASDITGDPEDGIPDAQQVGFIQLAESERRRATRRLLQGAARDVYNRMIEGF